MSLSDFEVADQASKAAAATPRSEEDAIRADALSGARRWAVNEIGAAIAHQLVEPLTALLLYMHELRSLLDESPAAMPIGTRKIVQGAVQETERVCVIMERIGNQFEGPEDSESAVMRGRDAITWWSRSGNAGDESTSATKRAQHDCLTPREREVLDQISGGATNKEGALRLRISPRTFEAHRAEIMRKLGARNTADLLRKVLLDVR
jgi:DNA-binding CsgD family transcriptional regulator